MNAIKLNANVTTPTGRKALEEALNTIQKGCRVRTLALEDIDRILERIERELNVPRYKLAGTKVFYTGAEHFPNAYQGRPESTQFTAEHNGRAWRIIQIARDDCPNRLINVAVWASDVTKAAVLDRLSNLII